MSLCSNSECAIELTQANRAHGSPPLCVECGELVYAFRPDSGQPDWFLICDGREPDDGNIVSGGQCEHCFLSEFLVRAVGKFTWVAACVGQIPDGEFVAGCGAEHPIRMKPRFQIIYPCPDGACLPLS